MDQGLRAKTPIEKFKKHMADGLLASGVELPDDKVLGYLYERAIDARADRVWVRAMQKIASSRPWKQHVDWLRNVTKLVDQLVQLLEQNDRLLPKRDAQQVRFVSQSVDRLRCRLLEIHGLDERGRAVGGGRNWNAALRLARSGMDRTLQKNCPGLNGVQRADIIKLAVEAAGLKQEDTLDAIVRQLNRERRR